MNNRTESFSDMIQRLFPFKSDDGRIPSRTIIFEVCNACQLRCKYCYEVNKGNDYMSFEIAKTFIDNVLQDKYDYINTKNTSNIVIEFIGGESLLAINMVSQITDYFIEQMIILNHPWATRFRISISSNGVAYFEPKVQEYIKKHNNHLSFGVSIDGNKQLHDSCRVFPDGSGSYDLAIKAVHHYANTYSGSKKSKMTLSPENIIYTKDAIIGLIDEGYTEINLNCVFENVWEQKHATILYYQLKELADYLIDNNLYNTVFVSMFRDFIGCLIPEQNNSNFCGGVGYMLAISYTGDIYPCHRYMESCLDENTKPLKIGNVYTGIESTDEEKQIVKEMKSVTRRSQSTDECFYCPIGSGCSWCSALNYKETGSINKRTTNACEMHKAVVLSCIFYFNKIYKLKGENKVFQNNVPDEWALKTIDQNELDMLKELSTPK